MSHVLQYLFPFVLLLFYPPPSSPPPFEGSRCEYVQITICAVNRQQCVEFAYSCSSLHMCFLHINFKHWTHFWKASNIYLVQGYKLNRDNVWASEYVCVCVWKRKREWEWVCNYAVSRVEHSNVNICRMLNAEWKWYQQNVALFPSRKMKKKQKSILFTFTHFVLHLES